MRDDEPLDLSALDPERDPGRWRALIEGTLARLDLALEERSRRDDPLYVIATWRIPLLALSHWPSEAPSPTGADFRRALAEPTR